MIKYLKNQMQFFKVLVLNVQKEEYKAFNNYFVYMM